VKKEIIKVKPLVAEHNLFLLSPKERAFYGHEQLFTEKFYEMP
jgi:hypothetical protein